MCAALQLIPNSVRDHPYCTAPPPVAIRQGLNGRVVAWVHVAPAGNVTQVEIKQSSNRVFDREVIRALSQWKFNPEPVGFIGEYEIVFNLKD